MDGATGVIPEDELDDEDEEEELLLDDDELEEDELELLLEELLDELELLASWTTASLLVTVPAVLETTTE